MASVMKGRKEKMKKILFGLGLFLLLYGPISSSEAVVDRIVAVVNQEVITLSEVERLIDPLQEEIQAEDRLERRERVRDVSRKVLERLIEEKLIDQEVKRAGIKVTNKEVENAVEEIRRQNSVNQQDFERGLAKGGFTLEAFKKEVEKRIQRVKLMSWAVKTESKVGEKELRDFYWRNIDQYRRNESYRPSHILLIVPKDASFEEVQEIKKRCQKVLEKIKGGEDFGEMAVLYSQDAAAKDGGDLGYFKKGELLPAFEKEALRLQIGEVSGIVRTDFGFHLIKLLDRKGGDPPPFEEIKEKVRADYLEKDREKAFQQFMSTLKEKSIIEIKL
jgi:peptidyl-prolyl cis-trans isomerase SurA